MRSRERWAEVRAQTARSVPEGDPPSKQRSVTRPSGRRCGGIRRSLPLIELRSCAGTPPSTRRVAGGDAGVLRRADLVSHFEDAHSMDRRVLGLCAILSAASGCAWLFHKPRPDLDLPASERPWRVRCNWVVASGDTTLAPDSGWVWGSDAEGRRLVVVGGSRTAFSGSTRSTSKFTTRLRETKSPRGPILLPVKN